MAPAVRQVTAERAVPADREALLAAMVTRTVKMTSPDGITQRLQRAVHLAVLAHLFLREPVVVVAAVPVCVMQAVVMYGQTANTPDLVKVVSPAVLPVVVKAVQATPALVTSSPVRQRRYLRQPGEPEVAEVAAALIDLAHLIAVPVGGAAAVRKVVHAVVQVIPAVVVTRVVQPLQHQTRLITACPYPPGLPTQSALQQRGKLLFLGTHNNETFRS